MDVPLDDPLDEITRLQRCVRDLISILALPAMWTGRESSQIVQTLVDALLGMLDLDLVCVRVHDPVAEAPLEMVRTGLLRFPMSGTAEVGEDLSIVTVRLGLHGTTGVVVAGSRRTDFPGQTERLLLGVAANQASIGLHEARLLDEQTRVAERETAERRRAEEDLGHMTRVLAMGALTAAIAHEVNQPLSGIITNASTCLRMLAADPPDIDGARDTARRTIRDGHRASDVITRLRALFSRQEPTAEPVDLNDATREVVALTASELERNRVLPRLELADDLPFVTGDRVQLQQVILNLIRNASDAMSAVDDRARQLLISTDREDADRVRVTVRDAGPGLDPHAMERLFEAFYTTKHGGMGIGLSVSRSIVESHQGRLWAAPNDGPGATFAFSLPVGRGGAAGATGNP